MGSVNTHSISRKDFGNRSRAEVIYDETLGDLLKAVPEVLLVEILSYVPARDLLTSCSLVCNQWRILINGHGVWKRKCIREGRFIPRCNFDTIPSNYYRYIYLKDPYGRNLVKNPFGKDRFQYWIITNNGGDGWEIEETPQGADPVPSEAGNKSCFATSYGTDTKHQIINLHEEGINEEIMDVICPRIKVGEWHAARFDCGSLYELKVVLLDKNHREIDKFHYGPFSEDQWRGSAWTQVKHIFSEYSPGVRYIAFEHSGKDTQFWAGHYGSKMTGGYVKIDFS